MNEIWIKSSQLKQLLSCSGQTIANISRASLENKQWRDCLVKARKVEGGLGRGGISYEFLLSSLPIDVQEKYRISQIEVTKQEVAQRIESLVETPEQEIQPTKPAVIRETKGALVKLGTLDTNEAVAVKQLRGVNKVKKGIQRNMAEQAMVRLNSLNAREKHRDAIKRQVLDAFEAFKTQFGFSSQATALNEFISQYNDKKINSLLNESVYEVVPSFSRTTFFDWKDKLKTVGHLGGEYERHRHNLVDSQPVIRDFILALLSQYPNSKPRHIVQALHARFAVMGGKIIDRHTSDIVECVIPDYQAVQRWLKNWKIDNRVLYTAMQSPDKSKSMHMPAFGNASAEVIRLNQLWEIDATPADVMLVDGRHSIIGMIDVYSRRVKLLVSKHPKGVSNGALLRRCLIDWGVCEEIKTDNGTDFTGGYFTRVLELLGIQQTRCAPFSGWQKPHIERFFKTLSHSFLFELAGNFIGHNVAERQDIVSRQSFADRLMKKNEALEISVTAEQLQLDLDAWVESVYHQSSHKGIKITPMQRYLGWTQSVEKIDNERALDVLLLPREQRSISKKGIQYAGNIYIHECFGSVFSREVEIQVDPTDASKIYVYAQKSAQTPIEFLCIAVCVNYITSEEQRDIATAARRNYVAGVQRSKKELKNLAKKQHSSEVVEEILQAAVDSQSKVVAFPKQAATVYVTEALEVSDDAVKATDADTQLSRDWSNESLAQARSELLKPAAKDEVYESVNERATRLALTWELTQADQEFLDAYRREYPELAEGLDNLRIKRFKNRKVG